MKTKVVAVIDWAAGSALKENRNFIERAIAGGNLKLREGSGGSAWNRSLTVMSDGSCELRRFSTAAAARRLGGFIVRTSVRKARNGQRV